MRSPLPWLTLLAWLTTALGACAARDRDARVESGPAPAVEATTTADPAAAFADLEARLLEGPSRTAFRITSEGAFAASLEGELVLGAGDAASLDARGTFGGEPVALTLLATDGRLVGGNGQEGFDGPVPAGLREALVIGMTRMGLLHNLARLVSGAPPDHAEGGVREWVQAGEVAWVEPTAAAPAGAVRGLAFAISVSGQRTAEAVVWVDGRGLPVARSQTVRFPGGEMRVREEYGIR